MVTIRTLAAAAGLAFIAGCSTTAAEYEAMQTALASPTFRASSMAECIDDLNDDPLADRQMFAAFMNVSLAATPKTFCKRVIGGIASGRLKHEDLRSGGNPSPNLIRIIRGS